MEPSQNSPTAWQATADLLARYDRPGPRYTSYPTAVEFSESVDADIYRQQLARADEHKGAPVSVYVHVPFCQERCLFCGCNVIVSPDKQRAAPYLELVRKELAMVADAVPNRRSLSQLHLGGGTPTYYAPAVLARFVTDILDVFPATDGAELAVEVDPRVTTTEHIDALADLGFNRISLGVQDLDEQVQRAIGRVQPVEMISGLIDYARRKGFSGINVDLIYGLPHQDAASFARTVDTVIGMGVDRCAAYSFAFVPWLHGHMKKLPAEAMPARDDKFGLFAIARERFLSAGYLPIGMDHFARPDDELSLSRRRGDLSRNFQGYSVLPSEDVIGLGISAIGDVAGAYVQNEKKLSRYQEAIESGRLATTRGVVLDDDDRLRRAVIHQLMCNFAIDIPAIEARFGIEFARYFEPDLQRLVEHQDTGAVTVTRDKIAATGMGELFIRNLAMCFDHYRSDNNPDDNARQFSRTV